jgi:hypothetical protein
MYLYVASTVSWVVGLIAGCALAVLLTRRR